MKRFGLITVGLLAILTLVSLVAAQSSPILWDPLGVPMSEAPDHNQTQPLIVSDDAGGAIIMWRDERYGFPDSMDVYAQRVDQDGNVLWAADGQPINVAEGSQFWYSSTMIPLARDGFGGAVATWQHREYTDVEDQEIKKIYAQRVDHLGNLLWGEQGVLIAATEEDFRLGVERPSISSNGSGGAFVTWTWYGTSGNDIHVQQVDASGDIQWGPEGVKVGQGTRSFVVHDGLGGAIVAWRYSYVIYAQRVNSNGEVQWAAGGIPISQSTEAASQHGIVGDGNGGAFIVWSSYTADHIRRINAQHVQNDGTLLWGSQGVMLTEISDIVGFDIARDSTEILVVWNSAFGPPVSIRIYAQKVDFSGNVLWSANGVPVVSTAPGIRLDPRIVSDGEGGAIIAWDDKRNQQDVSDIYAQHLDANGMPLWTIDGERIEVEERGGGNVALTSDGSGGAIVAWQSWNILAQRLGEVENQPPSADASGPYSVNEGGSVIVTASGSDPDGDPLTYDWDLDNNGSFETPGQSATFSAADLDGPSSHTITVQVTDSGDLSATDQTTVEVLNVAPTAIFTNTTGTIVEGQAATLAFSNQFDPGVDDTTAGFSYSYDCTDDGAFELTDASATSFVCDYLESGTFTARGRIRDKDGDFTDYTVVVTVLTPAEGIQDLIDTVDEFNLQQGIDNSLDAKLDAALQALDDLNQNNDVAAINSLQAFINAVEAQRGNKLTDAQADELVEKAQAVINSLS